jgi:uncharacterized membrane protein (UPF0127 family)
MQSFRRLNSFPLKFKNREGFLVEKCFVATKLLARMRGLLGSSELQSQEALWLSPCQQVHMWFMKFPIDVVFVNREGAIVGMESLKPWRISKFYWKAHAAIELAAGSLERWKLKPEDGFEVPHV